MDTSQHSLHDLFLQLGLPADAGAIDRFIGEHRPLRGQVALAEAPFWTPAQAAFLREGLAQDADWAEQIDELDESLR